MLNITQFVFSIETSDTSMHCKLIIIKETNVRVLLV